MSATNSVTLIGRVGQDPEGKTIGSGNLVTDFSIAVSRGQKDNEGNYISDWVPVKAWNRTAEYIISYVKKGMTVAVEGKLVIDKWKNEAGENKSKTYVNIADINIVDKKNKQDQQEQQIPKKYTQINIDEFEDDIPPF